LNPTGGSRILETLKRSTANYLCILRLKNQSAWRYVELCADCALATYVASDCRLFACFIARTVRWQPLLLQTAACCIVRTVRWQPLLLQTAACCIVRTVRWRPLLLQTSACMLIPDCDSPVRLYGLCSDYRLTRYRLLTAGGIVTDCSISWRCVMSALLRNRVATTSAAERNLSIELYLGSYTTRMTAVSELLLHTVGDRTNRTAPLRRVDCCNQCEAQL